MKKKSRLIELGKVQMRVMLLKRFLICQLHYIRDGVENGILPLHPDR